MTAGHEIYKEILQEFDTKIEAVTMSMTTSAIRFAETNDEKHQQEFKRCVSVLEYMKQCKAIITSRGGVIARLDVAK